MELRNFEQFGDDGEVWFGEDVQKKSVQYILKNFDIEKQQPSVLDVGTGNGAFLFKLAKKGLQNLKGIDYSEFSIRLSEKIRSELDYADHVKFEFQNAFEHLDQQQFDVIHDKGTFDVVVMNPDLDNHDYAVSLRYRLKKGGIFIITSCNCTSEELDQIFQKPGVFKKKEEIKGYKSFTFGGVVGQVIQSQLEIEDSQKSFDQCVLCLSKVQEPMVCKKGHLFCKICIIENLMKQKKQKDMEIKRYLREQETISQQKQEEVQKQALNKINTFESKELAMPQASLTSKQIKLQDLSDDQRVQQEQLEEMQKKKEGPTVKREDQKQEWIKTSFWAPDNVPALQKEEMKAPSKKLICPAQIKESIEEHQIKMKDLVNLKMEQNEQNEYICWICKKGLVHQKIIASKKCGHVMCKECVTKFCLVSNKNEEQRFQCNVCDKQFEKKDMIELKESGSAFASHSKVEATIQKPTFQC
ncbi:methyltransferase-like protein 10 [Stylonychia lemnae]|uniref:Methyltransferase-like protein 10 n=1 Tax=Stylonychia lemnae TaxID=5949 RepID=A0A078A9P2_STYLE|nr:methyltransferase-like protein 10 [Stylonychia lemnae]|eukprot:CDW78899.1 methyltransferase-like protein 10 [Stylonychia lemnae]